jgi:hypothetical protein
MARGANHEHVRRALEALAILQSEPGWHVVADLAASVGAKPDRLAADLRRACYEARDWHLPLVFGDDLEPPHPRSWAVVQLLSDVPTTLPLPASRAELLRWALLADTAIRLDPDDERAAILRPFRDRVTAELGVAPALDVRLSDPDALDALRAAIAQTRSVRFGYRALDAGELHERWVTPQRVWRDGRWWLLLGHDHGRDALRTFRVDRVVGDVTDAGPGQAPPADGAAGLDGAPDVTGPATPASVRLRIGADEQWAVDAFEPSGLVEDGASAEITVRLYPPVGARLSRLLLLLRPGATVVATDAPEGRDGVLAVHRRALAALRLSYVLSTEVFCVGELSLAV